MFYNIINFKKQNIVDYVKVLKYVNLKTFDVSYLKNRINVLTSYHYKIPRVKGYAPMVHIEPTNVCNLACEMCPRDQQDRPHGYMDFDMYKGIVDELGKMRTELIYLHLFGEPTLHPRIFDMIKYAKKKGIDVAMSTNSTTLDIDKTRNFLDSGIDILILSFDAADNPEYFERIRKNAKYQEVYNNIKRFLETKRGKKPFTILQTICMKGSENADGFLRKTFSNNGNLTISNKPFDEWGGKIKRINDLSTVPVRYQQKPRLCEKIWRTMMIHYNGDVVPCSRCYEAKYVLGNYLSQSLKDIWNGEKMIEMRNIHIKGRMFHEYCKTCYYIGLTLLEEVVLMLMDATFFEKSIHKIQEVRERKFTLT